MTEGFELPSAPSSRAGSAIRILIGLGIALPLIACGVLAYFSLSTYTSYRRVEGINWQSIETLNAEFLGPDGRWVLMQGCDWKGNPRVFTVDLETSKVSVYDCYRLASFDPSTATAWMVRDDGSDVWDLVTLGKLPEAERLRAMTGDSAWDAFDKPAADVTRLDVRTGELHERALMAWDPWISPSGESALFSVDASVGAWPKTVSLGRPGSEREVPSLWDGTVRPAGWSADGRYLAVVGLAPDASRLNGDELSLDSTLTAYVLDSVEATVAGTFEVFTDSSLVCRGPFWDTDSNTLYWTTSQHDAPASGLATHMYTVSDGRITTLTPPADSGEGRVMVSGSSQPGVAAHVYWAESKEATDTRVLLDVRDGSLADRHEYTRGSLGFEMAWCARRGAIVVGISSTNEPKNPGLMAPARAWFLPSGQHEPRMILDMGEYALIDAKESDR